jgi:hypothetical protein
MLCLQMKNSIFSLSNMICWGSFTPRSTVPTLTKKAAGVPSPACKKRLHTSQQPLVCEDTTLLLL